MNGCYNCERNKIREEDYPEVKHEHCPCKCRRCRPFPHYYGGNSLYGQSYRAFGACFKKKSCCCE